MEAIELLRTEDPEITPGTQPELEAALGQAARYLDLRALTSEPALRLSAQLKLAIGRGGSCLEVGQQILDYLASRARRPEALILTLQEGLAAERRARERRKVCGDCGAGFDPHLTAALTCPHCGAPRVVEERR